MGMRWVVWFVIGCSGSPRPEPEEPETIVPAVAAKPIDAAVAESSPSPEIAGLVVDRLPRLEPVPPRPCAPHCDAVNPMAGRKFPIAIVAPLTRVARVGTEARVRVQRTEHAIDRTWKATFVDSRGLAVPGGASTCELYGAVEIECATQLSLDRMTATMRFEPPREGQMRRVAGYTVDGATTVVTISAGSSDAITNGWKIELVDQAGDVIRDGACAIERIDSHKTLCRTSAKLGTSGRALLTPAP